LKKLWMCALAGALMMGAFSSQAAETKQRPFTIKDELTRSECGDCHMAFTPSRLTKNAWHKIMTTLSDHFGEDASLSAEKVKHIEAYLLNNALDRKNDIRTKMRIKAWAKKGIVDPIRISKTPEWTRHHTFAQRYQVMAKDVGYNGPNCIKCHKGAERGVYEDFGDRYPGGE